MSTTSLLQKGWTLGSAQMTALMHGLIRLYHGGQVRLLTEFWKQGERDLVVSLIPNFNRALRQSLPATPLVTHLNGPGRFSSALLDRTSGSIFDLRHREGGGAGARAGASFRAHLSRPRE